MTCHATQHSDRMVCAVCMYAWDVNDPHPPRCLPRSEEVKPKQTDKHRARQAALLEAAKPLMQHLAENYHPMHRALVNGQTVEVLETQIVDGTTEFIQD